MCPFCNGSIDYQDPEHAPYVVDGKVVCIKAQCRQRAIAAIQGVQKALELGIGLPPETFQLPLRLDPG